MRLRLLLALALALTGAFSAVAQDKPEAPAAEEAPPASREEALRRAGVNVTSGPASVALGKVAELQLPAGYHFVGPDSLDRFFELTRNFRSGNEVGVVVAPEWMLFFDYDDIGYVKDDDKDKLEADKLMQSLVEGQNASNEARKERGWDEMKMQGWATPPHYDSKTNNLKWAFKLSSSADGYKEVWINENIRLLGRGGVMNVTLVTDPEGFQAAETESDQLLAANFSYVDGQKYAEFKAGDKIAKYGLAALVVGGAGAVAAKTGLLAKLGGLIAKMGKLAIVAVIAIGAGVARLWGKITGKNVGREQ